VITRESRLPRSLLAQEIASNSGLRRPLASPCHCRVRGLGKQLISFRTGDRVLLSHIIKA
jgi:hypothetical protein